jgi:hypothetical protein
MSHARLRVHIDEEEFEPLRSERRTKLIVPLVLPTPPFWLTMAMIFAFCMVFLLFKAKSGEGSNPSFSAKARRS